MRFAAKSLMTAVLVIIGAPAAHAESCLQKFSCHLYGECRLPCLDEITGAVAPISNPPVTISPVVARDEAGGRPARAQLPKMERKTQASSNLAYVRIIAGKDIGSLADLTNKPVSFGADGGPTQAVGRKVFAKLGIKIAETPLEIDNALDGVATGDVAAVVILGERDAKRLRDLKSSDLHLLLLPAGAPLPTGMTNALIPQSVAGALARGLKIRSVALNTIALHHLGKPLKVAER